VFSLLRLRVLLGVKDDTLLNSFLCREENHTKLSVRCEKEQVEKENKKSE